MAETGCTGQGAPGRNLPAGVSERGSDQHAAGELDAVSEHWRSRRRDAGASSDPLTSDGDCAMRVVQGTDVTVLGGALYDQFTTGSYTGQIDFHDVGGSTGVSSSSISTIDVVYDGTPFVELSMRADSKHCTPQVPFSTYLHLWSEDGVSFGSESQTR